MAQGFDDAILKNKGFKQRPDGSWYKPKKGENTTPPASLKSEVTAVSGKGIFIPYNVPSSKNSRSPLIKKVGPPEEWTAYLPKNKLTRQYSTATQSYYKGLCLEFQKLLAGKHMPYVVCMHFVRSSKRKFDLHNACQIVCDLMQKHNWIPDDDADTIRVDFSRHYSVDKSNPGVWIDVL